MLAQKGWRHIPVICEMAFMCVAPFHPPNREVAPKSYSVVKTWQSCRNEWRLSSCPISQPFTFVQDLAAT